MTSTTHHETQIVADPDVPLVRIVREFDAPPEKVFRAHIDPELVVQWLGPRDLHDDRSTTTTAAPAAPTGTSHTPGTTTSTASTAASTRCGPNELIVQTFTFEGVPDSVALEKLVLEDLGDGRTRLTATSLVDSFETATPSSPAAWRTASSRATSASTSSSPPADRPTDTQENRWT